MLSQNSDCVLVGPQQAEDIRYTSTHGYRSAIPRKYESFNRLSLRLEQSSRPVVAMTHYGNVLIVTLLVTLSEEEDESDDKLAKTELYYSR